MSGDERWRWRAGILLVGALLGFWIARGMVERFHAHGQPCETPAGPGHGRGRTK